MAKKTVRMVWRAYAFKVHSAVVGSCYTSGGPCTEHVCLCGEAVFLEGDWSISANIAQGKGVSHQPLWCQKNYSDCHFMWHQNICSASFSFATIHASDRHTDRHTDRIAIAIPCAALHAVGCGFVARSKFVSASYYFCVRF